MTEFKCIETKRRAILTVVGYAPASIIVTIIEKKPVEAKPRELA